MSWNYAELSKMAKENGGPEALVDVLIQSGVSRGKESMYPVVAGALLAGIVSWEGGKRLWKKFCSMFGESHSEADIQKAKKELVQGIRNYETALDIENPSENDPCE